MINWPDIKFPPINLNSMPRMALPHMYKELETEYIQLNRRTATDYLKLQAEFNKLWNDRARNG